MTVTDTTPDTTNTNEPPDTDSATHPHHTTTLPVRIRRHAQDTALWLARLPLRRPGRSLVALTMVYAVAPLIWSIGILATYAALIAGGVAGREALVRASTLTKTLQFAYRRWRVCRKFRSVMLHASIAETPVSMDETVRHGDGAKLTPKVLRRKATPTPVGLRVVVDGHNIGADAFAFQQRSHVIRTELGCRDIAIYPDPGRPYLTVLQLTYSDPFKTPIAWSELPASSGRGLVVVGLDEMGNAVEKSFWLPQLIAGSPGSGKSTEAWCQVKGLVDAGVPFLVHVFDPKGGTEFASMESNAWSYAQSDLAGFLQRCVRVLAGRQFAMRRAGIRECPVGDAEFPIHLVVIDELVTALALAKADKAKVVFNGQRMSCLAAFCLFLTQIRSANIVVIGLTQLVTKDVIPMRGLFPHNTCMRIGDPESVRIMLGGEEAAKQYPAHRIPPIRRTAGIAYATSEETGQVVKYRGAFLSDAERDEIAVACGVWTRHYREVFKGRGKCAEEEWVDA